MISFSNVTKRYGSKVAVDGVSFSLREGEVVALLGPNGAGKSTSMKMLTGYIPVTEGAISVCGYEMQKNAEAAQLKIGYLPEGTPLYTEVTVIEFLRFAAAAREIPPKHQNHAVSRVIECCGLKNVQYQLIDTLSKGYRQRTCLAQSIVHDPDVLVLDEPTDGLDPNQKQEIQNMIHEMSQNKSILLSTHIMEEAEFMSTRILLLNQGKLIAEGAMNELRKKLGHQQRIFLKLANVSSADAQNAIKSISSVDDVYSDSLSSSEQLLTIYITVNEDAAGLLSKLAALCHEKMWKVTEMKIQDTSLKDIFTEVTRS